MTPVIGLRSPRPEGFAGKLFREMLEEQSMVVISTFTKDLPGNLFPV